MQFLKFLAISTPKDSNVFLKFIIPESYSSFSFAARAPKSPSKISKQVNNSSNVMSQQLLPLYSVKTFLKDLGKLNCKSKKFLIFLNSHRVVS